MELVATFTPNNALIDWLLTLGSRPRTIHVWFTDKALKLLFQGGIYQASPGGFHE